MARDIIKAPQQGIAFMKKWQARTAREWNEWRLLGLDVGRLGQLQIAHGV